MPGTLPATTAYKGIVIGDEPGFYGDSSPHILAYVPGRTVHALLAPFIARDVTVCHSVHSWLQHLAWVVYALVIMLVLGQDWAFPDGKPACNNGGGSASTTNRGMCHLEDLLRRARSEFRFLVAFILAGFVAATVGMWRERRQNYARLCGATRNLTIQIASLLPIDDADLDKGQGKGRAAGEETLLDARTRLGRWVILAFELAVLKARGHMDTAEGRAHLDGAGLLAAGEWEALVPGDRHSTVFFWIQTQLRRLLARGALSEHQLVHIAEAISGMRGQANDLMSSLDRDKPMPYAALCGSLVSLNVLINSTWKGVEWAAWFYGSSGGIWLAQPKIWVDVLVLFTWNLSYMGLYDLAYVLNNPFGHRVVDVAHETIAAGLRRLAEQLMAGTRCLPPTMTGRYDR